MCVCVSRGCRLGLASGRWRRGSLNNLTKPQPPDYGHVPGRMHDSCSGQKGARQGSNARKKGRKRNEGIERHKMIVFVEG